jgi:serine/threonine-protein kinase HipA
VKKLRVIYNGWGEHWQLATLAHAGTSLLFEYSAEALRQGLELSEPNLRLRREAYGGFPAYLFNLPGLIADSLPDGWGMLLMDRAFRKLGRNPAELSPLDRLAFIGSRGLGALTFEPAEELELQAEDIQLLRLAEDVRSVIAGEDGEVLRKLVLLGGSPHGARPKALIHYDPATRHASTVATDTSKPWLVKFPAQSEHKEVTAIEEAYASMGRVCGLDVPPTQYFNLNKELSAFGIERFDVEDGMRVPVHTLAGLLHADFRIPSVDYGTFLRATRRVTRDNREVQKAYERVAFNVAFHNRDDHSKNFSFRLGKDRLWRLSPCYDLTFCEGPGGQHQMDVCGEGANITRAHMLKLAEEGGLTKAWASDALDRIVAAAEDVPELLAGRGIRKATISRIVECVELNRSRLR